MDVNQIIQMGEKIVAPSASSTTGVAILIVCGFLLLCCILSAIGGTMRGIVGAFSGFIVGIFIFMIAVSFGILNNLNYEEAYDNYKSDIKEWQIITKLYINSLPVEKREVVYIKIDPELSANSMHWSKYTYSSEIKRTPITTSFKDGDHIITETQWFETTMELTDEEKPYIEYQQLPTDLGHGVNAGIYNAKIHLPRSYSFTDIK